MPGATGVQYPAKAINDAGEGNGGSLKQRGDRLHPRTMPDLPASIQDILYRVRLWPAQFTFETRMAPPPAMCMR